ncbi:hypothetical protein HRG_006181 [Hirsutella rhossiliensis]|uniref:Ribosome biogenesis protein ALB1 n=1 Tax=Hirsutella rhossiliensis TaxID=111463 RepID=A0A9P8N0G7_9HYPO|nr:uncharacterized protein HRG_06181 [Hirsutella rhossiliensis]KAH0963671.1 hypothetical protein HRG_06181 [Hirsutella rhossiliensis]
MPSVKNPNGPSKNRLAARAAKVKKLRQKQCAFGKNKISKADITRGARPGLLPTSGPRAKLSAKKARKLDKKMNYAMKRKMEAEGEAEMKDAPEIDGEEKHDGGEEEMKGIQ